MVEIEEIFNPADFRPIRLLLEFENLTTKTKVQASEENYVVEFGDRALTFELPARSCAQKHSGLITVFRQDDRKKKPEKIFSSTGKVVEADGKLGDDEKMKVTMQLLQFDEGSWNSFLGVFSKRQEEITNMLVAMKF